MNASEITIGLAFLAGLASFLSPCVFSLVPAYVSYLGGRAVRQAGTVDQAAVRANRWVTFTHGLAFVLGFSVVFVVLGVAVSAAGSTGTAASGGSGAGVLGALVLAFFGARGINN